MRLLNLGHLNFQSLSAVNCRVNKRLFSSQKSSDPLRILFCGSDDFSVTSLKALHEEHKTNSESIASIDVVCRPSKRVGRGLKLIREVPIAQVARNLSLPVHEIDTFTGWTPPLSPGHGIPINLIIAVSFGLLVPPRILNGAKYAGLNVHPSLLPDFHGPAPLHHTLLENCSRTGVTLQTMHPRHFDQGAILDQAPFPGFEHGCTTVPELSAKMGPLGAAMLLKAIRNRTFVPPLEIKGWAHQQYHHHHQASHDDHDNNNSNNGHLIRAAPKITSKDSHIDWSTWSAEEILRKQEIVGPLWNSIHQLDLRKNETQPRQRRVIWSTGFKKAPPPASSSPQGSSSSFSSSSISSSLSNTGTLSSTSLSSHPPNQRSDSLINITTQDGQVLQAEKVTLDGERERDAGAALASLLGSSSSSKGNRPKNKKETNALEGVEDSEDRDQSIRLE